jgi:hypothetical protein
MSHYRVDRRVIAIAVLVFIASLVSMHLLTNKIEALNERVQTIERLLTLLKSR